MTVDSAIHTESVGDATLNVARNLGVKTKREREDCALAPSQREETDKGWLQPCDCFFNGRRKRRGGRSFSYRRCGSQGFYGIEKVRLQSRNTECGDKH